MKILYFGLESQCWVLYLMNELAKLGHEITVFTQASDDYDESIVVNKNKNITHYSVPLKDVVYTKRFCEKHLNKIVNKEFDVIMGSHLPSTPLIHFLSKQSGIPCVEMLLDIPTHLMSDPERKAAWDYGFKLMKEFDSIIFNTTICRDEYTRFTGKRYSDKNIIFYAINTDIADTLPCFEEQNIVITISRLHPQKENDLVLDAISLMKNKPKYVAIGRDCGELPKLREKAKKYEIEFFSTGVISEIKKWELIKSCKCLVYPQSTEYIGGLSPFEAFYAGKRAVVADVGVLRELYGDNAVYFERKNAKSLAEKLEVVFETKNINERKGKEWTERVASFPVMAKKISDILEEVIK